MGIKDAIVKAAGKAGDAVAKVSSLSPEQLERVQGKRDEYLSKMPDPNDAAAQELTRRLMAACGVEIYGSYLPQIADLYVPVDPSAEYGRELDADHNIRSINITKWVVDADEDNLEKLVGVYEVLSAEECNIALVFHRSQERTEVYFAVVDTENSSSNVNADSYIRRVCDAVRGSFPGSEWSGPEPGTVPPLRDMRPKSVAAVTNIPAEKSEGFSSQTIEKLLDGTVPEDMSQEYTLVLLATPVLDVEQRKLRLSELYTGMAPYAGWQTGFTFTETDSTMSMATVGVNVGASAGVQGGQTAGVTTSDGVTDSSGSTVAGSVSETITDSTGISDTDTKSVFGSATGSYSATPAGIGPSASGTIGGSMSSAHGTTSGHSVAGTVGQSVAKSLGRAATRSLARSAGGYAGKSFGANIGASFARSSSVTATIGKNESIQQSFVNHTVKHALEVLDLQMARLEQSAALGMWDFAAYVLCEDVDVANNVAHSYLALTQGEGSYLSSPAVNLWRGDLGEDSDEARAICGYLRDLRHPAFALSPDVTDQDPTFNVYPAFVTATTGLSGKELSYSLNFPKKSVCGLPVIECAAFGRNVSTFEGTEPGQAQMRLGKSFHMHREERNEIAISIPSLASHAFVTGSTGAGKSNTVALLLERAREQGVKFLVVEPAKGEYKDLFGGDRDVAVYGTNPRIAPLLKVNPFSFPDGVHVLEHLDRLVEILKVCWPMYAAMPAVLKDALERSYIDCGWNLRTSRNAFGEGLWPTFSDVARNVKTVLDTSEYDAENKGAYKGSLLTRLQSLCNGLNGMMLSSDEVAPAELFDQNVVVDLSRVGSSETKSLLMGVIVLKLQEHRMASSEGANAPLRHLTVLEEAHNLLKRVSTEQPVEGGNLAGKSVEMLSNAIAEMRTYGEGFLIVDQAPGLVDMSAIRNTNTKVIMRLPDLADRQLVGKAASLSDSQIDELARLPRGVAAVYQNDWVEPVLCKVDKARDGSRYDYVPEPEAIPPHGPGDALAVAEVLANGTGLSGTMALSEVRSALGRLGLAASLQVAAMRYAENPPSEPKMTKLAPIMSALFPSVKEAVARSYSASDRTIEWTDAAESELASVAGSEVDDRVRRVVVQGVITDYVLNELADESGFKDWYQRGGLK